MEFADEHRQIHRASFEWFDVGQLVPEPERAKHLCVWRSAFDDVVGLLRRVHLVQVGNAAEAIKKL